MAAPNQRPIGKNSHHSRSMLVLVPQSGDLHQILQWYLRSGARFSPHRNFPRFQISHVPNAPPPPVWHALVAAWPTSDLPPLLRLPSAGA